MYEICVESVGQDDFVICWLGSDPAEALAKLEGITRLCIDCCLRYFVRPEDFKEEGE